MRQDELEGLAEKVQNVYSNGCYFLCLLFISFDREPTLEEIIEWYDKLVSFNYMTKDCYILKPGEILAKVSGKPYTARKSRVNDITASKVIGEYVYSDGLHFVVMEKNAVKWDPYTHSRTVSKGVLNSYRLFYRKQR